MYAHNEAILKKKKLSKNITVEMIETVKYFNISSVEKWGMVPFKALPYNQQATFVG